MPNHQEQTNHKLRPTKNRKSKTKIQTSKPTKHHGEREREREREISKRELIGRRGSKACELIGRRQVVTPSGGIEIWHICWVWIRSLGASSRLERERERERERN